MGEDVMFIQKLYMHGELCFNALIRKQTKSLQRLEIVSTWLLFITTLNASGTVCFDLVEFNLSPLSVKFHLCVFTPYKILLVNV